MSTSDFCDFVLLVIASCLLAVVMVVQPGLATDVPPPPDAASAPSIAPTRSSDERSAILQARISAKETVVSQVLSGEIPRDDAVEAFRYLNATPSWAAETNWQRLPGANDTEKLRHQLDLWLEEGRERAEAARRRGEDAR